MAICQDGKKKEPFQSRLFGERCFSSVQAEIAALFLLRLPLGRFNVVYYISSDLEALAKTMLQRIEINYNLALIEEPEVVAGAASAELISEAHLSEMSKVGLVHPFVKKDDELREILRPEAQ